MQIEEIASARNPQIDIFVFMLLNGLLVSLLFLNRLHAHGIGPRSFINIVEAGKFPAAFGQFKNEANRCVFPVVWSILERAVDPILPVGCFVRFGLSKTLCCIGLAFENLAITAREFLF